MRNTARLPLRPEVETLRERLVAMRRDFHAHPEVSWNETRTQAVILERLKELGLSDIRPSPGPAPLRLSQAPTRAVRPLAGRYGCLPRAREDGPRVRIKERRRDARLRPRYAHGNRPRHRRSPGRPARRPISTAPCVRLPARGGGRRRRPGHASLMASSRARASIAHSDSTSARICPIGAINVAAGPLLCRPHLLQGRNHRTWRPRRRTSPGRGRRRRRRRRGHRPADRRQPLRFAPSDQAVLTIGTMNAGFRWNVIADSATLEAPSAATPTPFANTCSPASTR